MQNDSRFANGILKTGEKKVSDEPQKQTRPKSNDLNTQIYDREVVINNNYHRIPINDTSSRRNHERHVDQEKEKKELPQNGFTVPNEAVSAKSYPLKDEKATNGKNDIKMEVDESANSANDSQGTFETPKTEDKELR